MLTRTHDLEIPLAIVFGIGVVLIIVTLVLMTRRRHRMIIRERSFALLLISGVGNLAVMIIVSVDGLFGENFHGYEWLIFYLNITFEYLFFAPYFLRIYHMKVSYLDFSQSPELYTNQSQRLTIRWFTKLLVCCYFPYILIPAGVGVWFLVSDCEGLCGM